MNSPSETLRESIINQLMELNPAGTYKYIQPEVAEYHADAILSALLNKLPEKPKYADIPEMGPGVSYDFMQGYGRGEFAGKTATLDTVRLILEGK